MKKFLITLVTVGTVLITSGCNRDMVDTVFSYDKAMIRMPDGTVVKGNVESWKDYEDGEQLQIKIDGKTYLVHAGNACLIEGED